MEGGRIALRRLGSRGVMCNLVYSASDVERVSDSAMLYYRHFWEVVGRCFAGICTIRKLSMKEIVKLPPEFISAAGRAAKYRVQETSKALGVHCVFFQQRKHKPTTQC